MGKRLEEFLEANRGVLGANFGLGVIDGPTILQMLAENRIRYAETDSALLIEIEGEVYSLPDGWMLSRFP